MSILRIRDANGNVQEILAIKGEDYVLTEADKVEIAGMINEGSGASASVTAHLTNTDNPHSVTAAQVGAVAEKDLAGKVEYIIANDYGDGGPISQEVLYPLVDEEIYQVGTAMLYEAGVYREDEESGEEIAHAYDTNNPHNVTCEQIGAVTQAELEGAVATALNNASIAYVGSATPTNDLGKDGDIYIVSG